MSNGNSSSGMSGAVKVALIGGAATDLVALIGSLFGLLERPVPQTQQPQTSAVGVITEAPRPAATATATPAPQKGGGLTFASQVDAQGRAQFSPF